MAEARSPYRSLVAAGMGAETAAALVRSTIEVNADLTVHELAPGRMSVTRTRRPTWAVVLCVCTIWIGGLGLLFLLVKQTEDGEIVVNDGPRGCVVALPPIIDAATANDIDAALRAGTNPPPPAPIVPAPKGPAAAEAADEMEGRTVVRSSADPAPPLAGPVAQAVPTPARVVLRFDAGEVVVEAGQPVVLGRDPSPSGAGRGQIVPGDATTVSKSHLLVHYDATAVTVEDLGSTNGSTITRGHETQALIPGIPVRVVHGDRVSLGTATFVVHS